MEEMPTLALPPVKEVKEEVGQTVTEEGADERPVVTESDAEDSLKRLAYWEAEEERIIELALREREKIDRWLQSQVNRIQKRKDWHEHQLRQFLQLSGKKKHSFPSGTLSTRRRPGSVEIIDEDIFVAWCRTNVEESKKMLEFQPKVSKKAIKEYIQATGCIPDGMDMHIPPDTLVVKVDLGSITLPDPDEDNFVDEEVVLDAPTEG